MHNASKIYLIQRSIFALSFQMVITFELVYHTVVVGLDPWQLIMTGIVLETMTFVFEMPTGVLADSYSRKWSIVIGFFLSGIGFAIEGAFANFLAVLIAQVFWGIGFTFISGATEAWISDEVGAEKASRLFLSSTQLAQMMALIGIGVSVLLATIHIGIPIFFGGILMIGLGCFLALFMSEEGFTPQAVGRRQLRNAVSTTVMRSIRLVRERRILRLMLGISFVQGMSLGGFDRLWAAQLFTTLALSRLGNIEPVVWFGFINAITMLLSIITVGMVRKIDLTHEARIVSTLLLLYLSISGAMLVFAATQTAELAIVSLLVVQTARATLRPVFIGWVNQHAETQVRATVISSYWQSNAMGQISFAPIVGAIGTIVSVSAALSVGALALTLTVPLLWLRRWLRVSHSADV